MVVGLNSPCRAQDRDRQWDREQGPHFSLLGTCLLQTRGLQAPSACHNRLSLMKDEKRDGNTFSEQISHGHRP